MTPTAPTAWSRVANGVCWNTGTANYNPYISDLYNQQQPYWVIDGTTNQLYGVNGGYINNGSLYSNGNFTGISGGMVGKEQNGMFYGLQNRVGGD